MKRRASESVRPPGVLPWSRDERGRRVWGLPVDPAWWRTEAAAGPSRTKELRLLAGHSDDLDGGPGCMAALVASAIEQVTAWEEAGLVVKGRRWADLGGASGHYALALHLAGASHVTLLDEDAPGPWALPVLWAAGIEIILGDAEVADVPTADAALLLYAGADLLNVLAKHPTLRLLVTNAVRPEQRHILERCGWSTRTMMVRQGDIVMGEGGALPGYERPDETEALQVCEGQEPLLLPGGDDFEGESTTAELATSTTGDAEDDGIPF